MHDRFRRGRMDRASHMRVMLIMLVVPLALGALAVVRPGNETYARAAPATVEAPLGRSEALRIWARLDAARLRMYRTLDLSIADRIYTPGSGIYDDALRELRMLRRDRVRSRTRFTTRAARVVTRSDHGFVVVQEVLLNPRFLDRYGRDITTSGPLVQRIHWTVMRRADDWLLHAGVIVSSRRVG